MTARRSNRTYHTAAQAQQAKVAAARQELLASARAEEPMHRYSHPIPTPAPAPARVTPTPTAEPVAPSPRPSREEASAMTQILEQLSCQSQLLVDLLGAVNSLTAAVLCQNGKS